MIYVFVGLGVLVAFWFVLMFFIALCEKQYLVGDIEPASEPYPLKPSPYWLATREHARMAGMICVGNYATKRNTSLVKGLESIWVTPDRTIAAAIVGGSFLSIPLKKTVLRTRLNNGWVLSSSDLAAPADPTGLIQDGLLLNASISELLTFHRQRIAMSGAVPVPFVSADVLSELEQIQLERGRRLVELRLARWANREQTIIRGTLRGALRAIFKGGELRQMQEQQGRMDVRRAGA
jgi:hypothetical protein